MARRKIVHRSKYYSRTEQDGFGAKREKAFADQWEKENDVQYSTPVALGLLCVRDARPDEVTMFCSSVVRNREMTQEIATDAATVIQWLGTNVGYCFLEMALDRVGLKIVKKEANNG